MELSTRARRRLSTVLALILAAESLSAVSVAATSVATRPAPVEPTTAATVTEAPARITWPAVVTPTDAGTPPRFALSVAEPPERPVAAPQVVTAPAAPTKVAP